MRNYLDDLFMLIGCGVVVYATFLWSAIAGWYAVGIMFIAAGIMTGSIISGTKEGRK